MEAPNEQVLELVRRIHRQHDIEPVYRKCLLFMIDCLNEVITLLPPPGRQSLQTAERFCHGRVSAASLQAERVRLWAHLDRIDQTYAFDKRSTRLLRAVLCVLYATPVEDADVYRVLEWFLQMYDPQGRWASRTLALLKMRFDDLL